MIQILEVAKKNFKFLLKLSSIKKKQTNIQTMNKKVRHSQQRNKNDLLKNQNQTSLMAQWVRIGRPVQGKWV